MTSNIIYHDFSNSNIVLGKCNICIPSLPQVPRVVKAARYFNKVLNALCTLLCGACVGISITVLVNLLTMG